MSDTIYSDLKEQGLILSKEVEIGFPPIRAPKPGLIGQLVSYVVPEKNFENEPYDLIIIPILNNCFIVGRCNTLLCYKYEIDREK